MGGGALDAEALVELTPLGPGPGGASAEEGAEAAEPEAPAEADPGEGAVESDAADAEAAEPEAPEPEAPDTPEASEDADPAEDEAAIPDGSEASEATPVVGFRALTDPSLAGVPLAPRSVN